MNQFKEYYKRIFYLQRYLLYDFSRSNELMPLEVNRIKQINIQLKIISTSLELISITKSSKVSIQIITESIIKIERLIKEPLLNNFPDFQLWLMNGDEPVGICNIKASEILWSHNRRKRGSVCNKYIYTSIKVNHKSHFIKHLMNKNIIAYLFQVIGP